jgi:hypothetical protein
MCVSHANAAPRAVCHQKRHCSGAFRSHDMNYGLSEALWTLAISLECDTVYTVALSSRYPYSGHTAQNATR